MLNHPNSDSEHHLPQGIFWESWENTLVMLTLEEISELDADMGEAKPMDEYLENFDTNIQSKTPYSDVTQVSTTLTT